MILFKTHIEIFIMISNAMSMSCLLTLQIPATGPPLIKPCCRLLVFGGGVRGSCDRMNIGCPTE